MIAAGNGDLEGVSANLGIVDRGWPKSREVDQNLTIRVILILYTKLAQFQQRFASGSGAANWFESSQRASRL